MIYLLPIYLPTFMLYLFFFNILRNSMTLQRKGKMVGRGKENLKSLRMTMKKLKIPTDKKQNSAKVKTTLN